LTRFTIKADITHKELQQLMLEKRISVSELSRDTCIKENDIRGFLTGRKTIPTNVVDRINQIGEKNGR
jgi:DNA-binding Xre family transcriptional regulator